MQFSQVPNTADGESCGDHLLVSRVFIGRALGDTDGSRHIFCLGCADGLGLSHPTGNDRRCPACQTLLANPDDAVLTILNPTEDYKTSVLSGLDPNTIMECAGRALGFWAYQSTQEMYFPPFTAFHFSRLLYRKLTWAQILPRILGEEPHRKVCQPEHADGQACPQRQLGDINPPKQDCRFVASYSIAVETLADIRSL